MSENYIETIKQSNFISKLKVKRLKITKKQKMNLINKGN